MFPCRIRLRMTSGACCARRWISGAAPPARRTHSQLRSASRMDTTFYSETRRLAATLASGTDLSSLDATRVLAAAEVAFASDVFGAGVEWETVTGMSDAETIKALRGIQRK